MPKQQYTTRPWRAIHESWLQSERLSLVSDRALSLFFMLLTKQDDGGRLEWTQTRVLSLVAVRAWSFKQATKYLEELAKVGSVIIEGRWVTLHRGAEFNGTPASGSAETMIPRFYPGYTASILAVDSKSNPFISLPEYTRVYQTGVDRSKRPSILAVSLSDWSLYLTEHWLPFITSDWQANIIATYPNLNLLTEAQRCVDWWAVKPDKSPKRPALAFRNWLVKATEIIAKLEAAHGKPGAGTENGTGEPGANSGAPGPARPSDAHQRGGGGAGWVPGPMRGVPRPGLAEQGAARAPDVAAGDGAVRVPHADAGSGAPGKVTPMV